MRIAAYVLYLTDISSPAIGFFAAPHTRTRGHALATHVDGSIQIVFRAYTSVAAGKKEISCLESSS